MPNFQKLAVFVNIGGQRDNVVYRGVDNPVTYPEMLVLQMLHGGAEHVHSAVDIGETEERDVMVEFQRLQEKYGKTVAKVFPQIGNMVQMPNRDDSIPTEDEVAAANAAAAEAKAKVRSAKKTTSKGKGSKGKGEPAAEPDADKDADGEDALPNLNDLPS